MRAHRGQRLTSGGEFGAALHTDVVIPDQASELAADPLPRLIMISGPIASGKSTVAAEVASQLRQMARTVALVDLDTVAEMALPTLPDWEWAHRIHAELVGLWLSTDIDNVVDEGTSSPAEVKQLLAQVSDGDRVLHVVLTTDFERALALAQLDPTRGLSKERDFLRRDHDQFAAIEHLLPCHLRLHTEDAAVHDLVDEILRHALAE